MYIYYNRHTNTFTPSVTYQIEADTLSVNDI